MKSLLYIGNQLDARGGAPTSIDILAPLLEKEDFNVKATSGKRNKLLRMLEMLWHIFKYRKWANCILIDTYSTQNFWYAVVCAWLCRINLLPYFLILHGGNLPMRLEKNPRISANLFKQAKLNIAPSAYLFEEFQQARFRNLKYIPNFIFLKNYQFKLRKNLEPRLLWVRAFDAIYNPILAIKVLEELLKEYPKAELCMVGPQKDHTYKECVDYAKKHKLPVKFTGKLVKREWLELSADYDIFLNTTNIDNAPVSIVEAMALGLPIVSTKVGGIAYLLQHKKSAFLVPPADVEAMLVAVKKLLKNPALAEEIAKNARNKAETLDWENVKKEWKTVLSSGY